MGSPDGYWNNSNPSKDLVYTNYKNSDYPPLSDIETCERMPDDSEQTVDVCNLLKETPRPAGVQNSQWIRSLNKDFKKIIPETEIIVKTNIQQAKRNKAIIAELRHLLEYEKTLLEQLMTRCDKFSKDGQDNKEQTDEYIKEHKQKVALLDQYLTKLIEIPDNQPVVLEGIKRPIEQKILFDIVTKTTDKANNILVQLAMLSTIVHEVDLTVGDLKKHCTVMLKQIAMWQKMLKSEDCHQQSVLDTWNKIKKALKDLKDKDALLDNDKRLTAECRKTIKEIKSTYDTRITKLEEAVIKLMNMKYENITR